ncbi:hypothetical protein EVAR_64035_1 [Eumeta japonica]|uniref:Uncharacterized protein n=1 Tax=Eumeta variegata TaxID=151549 RepID=A0A4C1Z5S2_EUMVA|nr:hypothetical protein EVAR_64035_1 [Eumeta japonica]
MKVEINTCKEAMKRPSAIQLSEKFESEWTDDSNDEALIKVQSQKGRRAGLENAETLKYGLDYCRYSGVAKKPQRKASMATPPSVSVSATPDQLPSAT